MTTNLHDFFLQLVRLGIDRGPVNDSEFTVHGSIDWVALKALAERQGLTAVVLDGIDRVQEFKGSSVQDSMPQLLRLEWIGEVLQNYEARYRQYEKAIGSLAGWYNQHGFKMMVLKGYACSLDWPRPEHRPCGDIDIWLFGQQKDADTALGSWLKVHDSKFGIDNSHHHHTVFEWEGFTVENHYDFMNVHYGHRSKELDVVFKELAKNDSHFVEVKGASTCATTKVYLPSPNLHALFLLRHSLQDFAAAVLTLRQVLDWAFFVEKHTDEIDWDWLMGLVNEYHMTDFFNTINAICVYDLGFSSGMFKTGLQYIPALKERVLNDILEPAFTRAEPSGLLKRIVFKYRRWQGNAWKQEMCYEESRFRSFWTGVWNHLLKPSSI